MYIICSVYTYMYTILPCMTQAAHGQPDPNPPRPPAPARQQSQLSNAYNVHDVWIVYTVCIIMHGCLVYNVSHVHIAVSAHIYLHYYISLPINSYMYI